MADYIEDGFPRMQEVVLPLLRKYLPEEVTVSSWINDIDFRKYPIVLVRRVGGYRDLERPGGLDKPVVEITAYHGDGLIECEELYITTLQALYQAQKKQDVTEAGSITFLKETMGMTQFSSLFQDTWRVQGLIQMGIRPKRKKV